MIFRTVNIQDSHEYQTTILYHIQVQIMEIFIQYDVVICYRNFEDQHIILNHLILVSNTFLFHKNSANEHKSILRYVSYVLCANCILIFYMT